MADVKISQLPAATTPVAGTEVLPIVQSGTTSQVSINSATGITRPFTANGVVYASSTSALATGSALTFDGTVLTNTQTSASGGLVANLSNTTTGSLLQFSAPGVANVKIGNPNADAIAFYTFGAGSYPEQMRLTSTGLGIGTSLPGAKLTVAGEVRSTTVDGFRINNGTELGAFKYSGGLVIDRVAGTSLFLASGGNNQAILDSAGNLGLGVTPSAWYANRKAFQIGLGGSIAGASNYFTELRSNSYLDSGAVERYISTNAASYYYLGGGTHAWFTAPSGTAGNAITFTQAMTLDSSGNLLVGTTSSVVGSPRAQVVAPSSASSLAIQNQTASNDTLVCWNTATSGNNSFVGFYTEGSITNRGSITYNRAGGLIAYNTTSDYRAKDIIGPVIDSGTLIDSTPVYMGKMKWATEERPMFIAHEVPAYAHTGEKDAVDADGKPVYQQMDASALVPVMWAEIQSLRKRLADAGI